MPVVTDLPRLRELVEQSGSGVVAADAVAAAAVLNRLERRPADVELQADRGQWWLKDLPDGQGIGYDRFAKVVGSLLGG